MANQTNPKWNLEFMLVSFSVLQFVLFILQYHVEFGGGESTGTVQCADH